jgi:hypothetical protein
LTWFSGSLIHSAFYNFLLMVHFNIIIVSHFVSGWLSRGMSLHTSYTFCCSGL